MKKSIGYLLVLLFVSGSILADSPANKAAPTVTVSLVGGRMMVLEGARAKAVALLCEKAMTHPSGIKKAAVSKQMIESLREMDSWLEIVYPQSREVAIDNKGRKKLVFSRMLVPLSGYYATDAEGEPNVVMLYGDDTYRSNPLRSDRQAFLEITNALRDDGVALDEPKSLMSRQGNAFATID